MSSYYNTTTHPNGTIERVWVDDTPIEVPAIRIITVRAFMQRLLQSERIALRASTDDMIVDAMDDLRMSTYVNLDDNGMAAGLGYLVAQGLIAASQATDLLVDGTEAEAYRGVL